MFNLKKIISLLLAVAMLFVIVGCDGGEEGGNESTNKPVDSTKWFTETLKAPGDVFDVPESSTPASGAPIIAEISKQVSPGSSFIITGENFTGVTKAYLYSQSSKDNGKFVETKFVVSHDTSIAVTVPKDMPYGVYGVYVESPKGKSNIEYINKAFIWWNDLVSVVAGKVFNIYGENLTSEGTNKTYAYLVDEENDNRYRELEVISSDAHKVSVKIPEGLDDAAEYSIRLHNGHGGELGWTEAPEKVTFNNELKYFTGNKIDVTKYGADPANAENDDSAAIREAIKAAGEGDTIYFPAGTYMIDSDVEIESVFVFEGESADKVTITLGKNIKQAAFYIRGGIVEFKNMGFKDITTGLLNGIFIKYEGDEYEGEIFNFNIHDCKFYQECPPKFRKCESCIVVIGASGVNISDNYFECTQIAWTNNTKKVFINKNEYCGTFYTGPYYDQNAFLLWNTDKLDASENKMYGKDLLKDDSGIFVKDDQTNGRSFAIQQAGTNLYICKNDIDRSGLPADNAGEQIMLENVFNSFHDFIEGADSDTITLPQNVPAKANTIVSVVDGKGLTQWRFVKKVKGNVITVSEPWDIIPDKTSKVVLSYCFYNVAICDNDIDCFKNYNEAYTATCAIQMYGNTHNAFLNNNNIKNVSKGICITCNMVLDRNEAAYEQNSMNWMQVKGNKIEEAVIGIRYILSEQRLASKEDNLFVASFGVVIDSNEFKNMTDCNYDNQRGLGGVGIAVGTPEREYNTWPANAIWEGDWLKAALIENNTFENCAIANIGFYRNQESMVLRNNTVKDGSDLYKVYMNSSKPIMFN